MTPAAQVAVIVCFIIGCVTAAKYQSTKDELWALICLFAGLFAFMLVVF